MCQYPVDGSMVHSFNVCMDVSLPVIFQGLCHVL